MPVNLSHFQVQHAYLLVDKCVMLPTSIDDDDDEDD